MCILHIFESKVGDLLIFEFGHYCNTYLISVMGNELDKIEQNGNKIALHPNISHQAGPQLQEKVKVRYTLCQPPHLWHI